jgi:predicted site-specific integrase-resolvase
MPESTNGEWITLPDAAALLRMSYWRLMRLVHLGVIESQHMPNRRWLLRLSAVEQYRARQAEIAALAAQPLAR